MKSLALKLFMDSFRVTYGNDFDRQIFGGAGCRYDRNKCTIARFSRCADRTNRASILPTDIYIAFISYYSSDRQVAQIYLPLSGIILFCFRHSLAQVAKIITTSLKTRILVETGTGG
jgi:hypothetical protein